MKVFLDTNVLVSAFTTRGLCADVFRLILAEHELVLGRPVLDELERVLARRFRMPAPEVDAIPTFLHDYPIAEADVELPELDIRDPDDRPVLASALAAGADILISGDRDLLAIEQVFDPRIMNPRGFWEWSREAG